MKNRISIIIFAVLIVVAAVLEAYPHYWQMAMLAIRTEARVHPWDRFVLPEAHYWSEKEIEQATSAMEQWERTVAAARWHIDRLSDNWVRMRARELLLRAWNSPVLAHDDPRRLDLVLQRYHIACSAERGGYTPWMDTPCAPADDSEWRADLKDIESVFDSLSLTDLPDAVAWFDEFLSTLSWGSRVQPCIEVTITSLQQRLGRDSNLESDLLASLGYLVLFHDLQMAETALRHALRIREQVAGPFAVPRGSIVDNLIESLLNTLDIQGAIEVLEAELRKPEPYEISEVVRFRRKLGKLYHLQGRADAASGSLSEAVFLAEKYPSCSLSSDFRSFLYLDLAAVEIDQGNEARAGELVRAAEATITGNNRVDLFRRQIDFFGDGGSTGQTNNGAQKATNPAGMDEWIQTEAARYKRYRAMLIRFGRRDIFSH